MSFTKYHIAIEKKDVRPSLSGAFNASANLAIEDVKPDFEAMLPLLKRVGGPWNWPRREGYLNYLRKIIEHPETVMMLLKKGDCNTGRSCRSKR